jgi:hypothetical protein
LNTFLYRPDHLSRAALEFAWEDEAMRQASATQPAAPRVDVPDDPAAIADAVRRAVASERDSVR